MTQIVPGIVGFLAFLATLLTIADAIDRLLPGNAKQRLADALNVSDRASAASPPRAATVKDTVDLIFDRLFGARYISIRGLLLSAILLFGVFSGFWLYMALVFPAFSFAEDIIGYRGAWIDTALLLAWNSPVTLLSIAQTRFFLQLLRQSQGVVAFLIIAYANCVLTATLFVALNVPALLGLVYFHSWLRAPKLTPVEVTLAVDDSRSDETSDESATGRKVRVSWERWREWDPVDEMVLGHLQFPIGDGVVQTGTSSHQFDLATEDLPAFSRLVYLRNAFDGRFRLLQYDRAWQQNCIPKELCSNGYRRPEYTHVLQFEGTLNRSHVVATTLAVATALIGQLSEPLWWRPMLLVPEEIENGVYLRQEGSDTFAHSMLKALLEAKADTHTHGAAIVWVQAYWVSVLGSSVAVYGLILGFLWLGWMSRLGRRAFRHLPAISATRPVVQLILVLTPMWLVLWMCAAWL